MATEKIAILGGGPAAFSPFFCHTQMPYMYFRIMPKKRVHGFYVNI